VFNTRTCIHLSWTISWDHAACSYPIHASAAIGTVAVPAQNRTPRRPKIFNGHTWLFLRQPAICTWCLYVLRKISSCTVHSVWHGMFFRLLILYTVFPLLNFEMVTVLCTPAHRQNENARALCLRWTEWHDLKKLRVYMATSCDDIDMDLLYAVITIFITIGIGKLCPSRTFLGSIKESPRILPPHLCDLH
jgi:hypothetical protein